MEIDRQGLIKLLEAFVDALEVSRRELALYQLLFSAACKAKGLDESQVTEVVDRAKRENTARIKESHQAGYLDLLAKVPQLVDLLGIKQDEALRLLKEWIPKGQPN